MHLAAVTESVRVVIDRALYLPKDWAVDEEQADDVFHPLTRFGDERYRKSSANTPMARVIVATSEPPPAVNATKRCLCVT